MTPVDYECFSPETVLSPTSHSHTPTAHELSNKEPLLEMTTLFAMVVTYRLHKYCGIIVMVEGCQTVVHLAMTVVASV